MDDFETQQSDLRDRLQTSRQGTRYQNPQGRMVGGIYVAPNPLEYLSEALRSANAGRNAQLATQELKDLQGKRQTAIADALRNFGDKSTGAPAVASTTTPTQMPSFDEADAASMQGVEGYGATTGAQAARAPDLKGAYSGLLNAPDATLRQMGMKGVAEMAQQDAAKAQQQQYFGILQKAQTPQQAIAAGVPYETAKQYYESQNLGKTEVGRTAEVEGPNGEKLIQQFDKFGSPVGKPMPGYMAPQTVNQGNKITFAKPIPGQSFNVNMSPGESARLAQSDRQFNITQNQPIFNADAGGFVYKPTAQAPQGGVVKVEGLGNKPLNESQGNATTYGIRMAEADKVLKGLEDQGLRDTGKIRAGVGGIVGAVPLIGESLRGGTDNIFNALPSIMGGLSSEQQQALQARVNFVTAVLRKESGASISPAEFATAEKNYFPAPGDTDAVVKQKQAARQQSLRGMKIQAGPGASQIGGGTGTAAPTSSGW
jgi:hypothetical protein